MPQRALITGISGFIGGHLAEHLLASGDAVLGCTSSGASAPRQPRRRGPARRAGGLRHRPRRRARGRRAAGNRAFPSDLHLPPCRAERAAGLRRGGAQPGGDRRSTWTARGGCWNWRPAAVAATAVVRLQQPRICPGPAGGLARRRNGLAGPGPRLRPVQAGSRECYPPRRSAITAPTR